MNATFAYFTATARGSAGDTQTGIVKITLTNSSSLINSTEIIETTKALPGDVISVNGNVQNQSSSKVYYILRFNISIVKSNETEVAFEDNAYYTFSSGALKLISSLSDGTYNYGAATLESNTSSPTFNVSYKLDFNTFDNSYKNATIRYRLTALAVQFANVDNATSALEILMETTQIPLEYQQVQYIEATGTQWFNSGIKGNAKWLYDIKFTNTTRRQLMGYHIAGQTSYWGVQTTGYYGLHTNSEQIVQAGNRDKIIFDYGYTDPTHWTFSVNNTELAYYSASANVSNTEAQILAFGTENNYNCRAILYSCEVWQNGSLIAKFIPCYRVADGEIGLYNQVNGDFLTNSGTGDFLKGADV